MNTQTVPPWTQHLEYRFEKIWTPPEMPAPIATALAVPLPDETVTLSMPLYLQALSAKLKALVEATAAPGETALGVIRASEEAGMTEGIVWSERASEDPLGTLITRNPTVRNWLADSGIGTRLPTRPWTPSAAESTALEAETLEDFMSAMLALPQLAIS